MEGRAEDMAGPGSARPSRLSRQTRSRAASSSSDLRGYTDFVETRRTTARRDNGNAPKRQLLDLFESE